MIPIQEPDRFLAPARTPPVQLTALTLALLSITFVADVWLPAEVPVGPVYGALLLLMLWERRPNRVFLVAGVATALILTELVVSEPGPINGIRLVNAIAGISGLWLIAFGIQRYGHRSAERQRALRDAEDLRYALDQSAILATTNVKGDIVFVNDTFCEISKYPREELLDHNHRVLNSGLHPPEFFKEMWRTIANGGVWRGELRNRAKDGSLYWVDTTIVPFLDGHGKPYQYVSIRYDITERKLSEARLREQASLAQLGRMAAVVAHEVRNPLAGIRGALQVIGQRMPTEAPERGIVTEIVNRVDTLNDIVEDLLLFARPRPPVIRMVTFRELAAKIRTQCDNDPAFAHIVTTIDATEVSVHVDPEMFTLVLLNLVNNACQAMKGHGRIDITVHEVDGFYDVRVADTGPGMPADVQARLFEPFFTTKARGTGLGLATARRIIESHGGRLTLTCPEGGGTVATIHLPVHPPTGTAPAARTA